MRDIYSETEVYHTLEVVGKGTFGKVSKCWRGSDGELVAVKMMKIDVLRNQVIKNELKLTDALSRTNVKASHIVQFHEAFRDQTHHYLVFELLEKNLYQLLKENCFMPIAVRNIRTITCQMIKALVKLKELAIIHADLKPENIMVVDHCRHPFRVKLIDFGSASILKEVRFVKEPYIQSRFYRSPEILLGLPFCEKVDMWSLGCVVAELFLGWPLYPGDSEFDQVCYICETQGLPPVYLLNVASKANLFFKLTTDCGENHWQLRSNKRRPPLSEDGHTQGKGSTDKRKYILSSLDQLETMDFMERDSERDDEDVAAEVVDRHSMVQLLKQMLTLDSHQRIGPTAASQHPFISMQHLRVHPDYSHYWEKAAQAVRSALVPDTAPEKDGVGLSRPPTAGGGQRFLYAMEEESSQCPQGRHDHDHWGFHSPSLGCFQGNTRAFARQAPVPHQPDSSMGLMEGLMEGLCVVEASQEVITGGWAKDAQNGPSPSSSMEPSGHQANLRFANRYVVPETEQSREDPDIGPMLACFTRPCQRPRQPPARSSKSDPSPLWGCTSGPQGKNADEPNGSSPFYGDSITQRDLAEPKKRDREEQAACHNDSLEEVQFFHLEPEGYSCDCGQWWPAWTSDQEVAYLGYGPPACCSRQPKQSHPHY